jgi:hypothetical protein
MAENEHTHVRLFAEEKREIPLNIELIDPRWQFYRYRTRRVVQKALNAAFERIAA